MKCSKRLSWNLANNIYSLIIELIIKEFSKDKSFFLLYSEKVVRITPVLF